MSNFMLYSSSDDSDSNESMNSMIAAYLCDAILENSSDYDTMENKLQEVESENCDDMNDLGLPMEEEAADETSEVSFLNPSSPELLSENMFNDATSTTDNINTNEVFQSINFDCLGLPCPNNVELSSCTDVLRHDLPSFISQQAHSPCVIDPEAIEYSCEYICHDCHSKNEAAMGTSQMEVSHDEMRAIRIIIVSPPQVNNDSVQTTANTQPETATDLSDMSVGQGDPEINQEDDKNEE